MSRKIIIGSRGSDLALWQAYFFQGQLDSIGVESELKIIKTKGDRIQHLSFDKIEGKGFFTKEIEEQLLAGEIDVAIHSHKDLETQMPEGLTIAGVSYRENPSELLLIRKECVDASKPLQFKEGALIGTSSARRKAQVSAIRPDITIKDIRGNVPTRIDKLRNGDFDAILLANAGVTRLALDTSDLHTIVLDPTLFVPAPAQGVLAYQTREKDTELKDIVRELHHQDVKDIISIERGILSGFGGGCHIPIGVHAESKDGAFTVRASFAKEWETFSKRVRFTAGSVEEALTTFQSLKDLEGPKSVFISRELTEESYFKRGCKHFDIEVYDQTLIDTASVPAAWPKESTDWIFFASSNAVNHFVATFGGDALSSHKLGAHGEGTAATLAKYVQEITFIGNERTPEETSRSFASVVGNEKKVLFPISSISKRSIQNGLHESQVIDVVVYETRPVAQKINECDVYVFTSPSNAKSFVEAGNVIKSNAKVISIGPTTAQALSELGIDSNTAAMPHEQELFGMLF